MLYFYLFFHVCLFDVDLSFFFSWFLVISYPLFVSVYFCSFFVLAHKYKDLRPYTGGVTVVLGGDNCASSTKETDSRDVDLSDAGTYVAIH